MKRLNPFKNPLGWILAGGVVLCLTSPRAKKAIRKLFAKGSATTIQLSQTAKKGITEWKGKLKSENNHQQVSESDDSTETQGPDYPTFQ